MLFTGWEDPPVRVFAAVQVPAADGRAGAPLGRHPQRRLRLRVGTHRLMLRRHDHRRRQV